jgi:teichuronic acid biosynthesis glycosyltransferase TuaG
MAENGSTIVPRGDKGDPSVSVITPAYQAQATIARAVRSVRTQSFQSWEMVVVDDGSTDSTTDTAIIAASGDHRVRVVKQANAGTGAARNRGLAEARGEYIVFLDADDELLPDYMDRQLDLITRRPELAIIGCNVIMRDANRDALWTGPRLSEHCLTVEQLLVDNTISVLALVKRTAVESVGGLRNVYAEDYDLWLRLLLADYRHCHQPRVLGIYYRTPGSKSANRKREWVSVARMLRDYRRQGLLDSKQSRVALESERRFKAMYVRVRLEEHILGRAYSRARREVGLTGRSFANRIKFVAAVLLVFAAPPVYRALLIRFPSGYTRFAEVERAS